jgi:hypothetical protein
MLEPAKRPRPQSNLRRDFSHVSFYRHTSCGDEHILRNEPNDERVRPLLSVLGLNGSSGGVP